MNSMEIVLVKDNIGIVVVGCFSYYIVHYSRSGLACLLLYSLVFWYSDIVTVHNRLNSIVYVHVRSMFIVNVKVVLPDDAGVVSTYHLHSISPVYSLHVW